MKNPCNQLALNEGALLAILQRESLNAVELEGRRLIQHMKREVQRTTHGGAPGKPGWRKEIGDNLEHVSTSVTDGGVSMDFGYSPDSLPDMVRAMIVEDGSGSAAGGAPIHAGSEGRQVWDGDVSGRHPSKAKTEYDLPDDFNQQGNHFVENSVRLMETEYGEITELVFSTVPDSAYYGNVTVSRR